ncbi:MAG: alpha-1 2-mannosidase [Bacteroidetes bacterium]|nr:MAG: alpha-1 2-mannosidase [Bacteroidota bacterium]
MRNFTVLWILIVLFSSVACERNSDLNEPASYINPFIGTAGHGHTYPGATVPFGMVQLSPQTRLDGWDGCSGYHYTDSLIYGFAHTALSGTGVSDYGDILLMPTVGEPMFINTEYRSLFRKSEEGATAGYYRVKLDKPDVLAELTATTRVGYHKYTYPASEQSNIIIDLKHRDEVVDSWIEIVSDTEIRGMRRSTNWAKDMVWYFHMEFSKPFIKSGIAVNDTLMDGMKKAAGKSIKAFVGFHTMDNESVEVKVGLSAVDAEGAKNNLHQEVPDWNFEQVKANAFSTWNKEVSKILVKKGSPEQLKVFYTAMYHAMLQPNTFMDVDNRYRGIDRNIHMANNFTNYTVFSLWDTFRAWHPLMTIIEQQRTNDFIQTMLNMHEKGGLLPVWELAGNETFCMIGNHAIPVIADAWMKGIRGYDGEKALDAMINSANQAHFGLDVYRRDGYIPGDKEHESVSKTLEYAYNDWCIALMAKQLNKDDVYSHYLKAAQSYKNYFDAGTGFMRPRLNGGWITPFDPTTVDWHFTEANSWQYSFYVPQDINGLAELHGGKEKLASKIDELFQANAEVGGRDMKDITGLIGQYAHGNEPSHHMAYLYNALQQPWKTQQRVRQIMDNFYSSQPDGLIGNEDCGQMSAWLIMSAMGFYAVSPGHTDYAIGTPWFPEVELFMENGKTFKITASNLSKENFYIRAAQLNGKPYTKNFLSHADIMAGGHLHFEMTSIPEKSWGSASGDFFTTSIDHDLILPVPYISAPSKRIREAIEIKIESSTPDCEIFYTLDGSIPDKESTRYTNAFSLDKTAALKAIAYHNELGYSKVVEAEFVKVNSERSVKLFSTYHPNYHGGGDDGLIDGIRGAENWRLGGWQGYQGTDFEAIVDLGKSRKISFISAGFLQDIRSWIWMPKEVAIYVSEDGKTFNPLAVVSHKIPFDKEGLFMQDLGINVNTKARFVKVKASNFGTIPAWHMGAGGQAYIFIDEIIIKD